MPVRTSNTKVLLGPKKLIDDHTFKGPGGLSYLLDTGGKARGRSSQMFFTLIKTTGLIAEPARRRYLGHQGFLVLLLLRDFDVWLLGDGRNQEVHQDVFAISHAVHGGQQVDGDVVGEQIMVVPASAWAQTETDRQMGGRSVHC